MYIRLISITLIIHCLFILFCQKDKTAVGFGEDLGIYGTVTDVDGVPLKDVGVHLIFLDYPFYTSTDFSKISGTNSIVLSSFEAKYHSDFIMLHWTTASESSNIGFKILRSTQENGSYSLIDTYQDNPNLAGHINADTTNEYSYADTSVIIGTTTYWYKLIDVDTSGIETEHGPVQATGIIAPVPTEYGLSQNYPNPFNPTTTINFQTPQQGNVELNILAWPNRDTVETLIDKELYAGYYAVQWDGKNKDDNFVTNNLYIYRMEADTFANEKIMCLQMLDPGHIRTLNAVPLVSTNSNGKFFLGFSSIPFGEAIIQTDVFGNEVDRLSVSQNIKIVLIKDGYQDYIGEIAVDKNSRIRRTFRLTPE